MNEWDGAAVTVHTFNPLHLQGSHHVSRSSWLPTTIVRLEALISKTCSVMDSLPLFLSRHRDLFSKLGSVQDTNYPEAIPGSISIHPILCCYFSLP